MECSQYEYQDSPSICLHSAIFATFTLNAGSYSYLFLVDGNLALDPNASVTTRNEQVSRITINQAPAKIHLT